MTDPFDFEPRLEARLVAHAARASRPFDAAAIAASATAGGPRRTLAVPLRRPMAGRAFAPMAATLVLVGLLVALIGAMLLASGRPPFPAFVVPAPSNSGVPSAAPDAPADTASAQPSLAATSPTPTATDPSTEAGASELLVTTGKLTVSAEMPCDNVDSIDLATGSSRRLVTCADRVSISPDGSRAAVGGPKGVAIIELHDGRQVGAIDTGKPTPPDAAERSGAPRFGGLAGATGSAAYRATPLADSTRPGSSGTIRKTPGRT